VRDLYERVMERRRVAVAGRITPAVGLKLGI